MHTRLHKQTGSAHSVIIVILVLLLLGTIGYIFWQNFTKKGEDTTSTTAATTSTATNSKPVTYKTYTTDVYTVSFQYPDTWSISDVTKSDEEGVVSGSLTVTTTSGQEVHLEVGIRGIGGTCDTPATYKVIDTTNTAIVGEKAVNFSLILQPEANGTYEGYYGLTDSYIAVGNVQVCPNTFYYLFSPTNTEAGLIQFDAKRIFGDEAAAKAYVASDEYAAIKKMVSSLTY